MLHKVFGFFSIPFMFYRLSTLDEEWSVRSRLASARWTKRDWNISRVCVHVRACVSLCMCDIVSPVASCGGLFTHLYTARRSNLRQQSRSHIQHSATKALSVNARKSADLGDVELTSRYTSDTVLAQCWTRAKLHTSLCHNSAVPCVDLALWCMWQPAISSAINSSDLSVAASILHSTFLV